MEKKNHMMKTELVKMKWDDDGDKPTNAKLLIRKYSVRSFKAQSTCNQRWTDTHTQARTCNAWLPWLLHSQWGPPW